MFFTPKDLITFVLIALIVTTCGGSEERKAAYREQAQKFLQQGNLEKARVELNNVLQIDPKDKEAHFELADVLEKLQDWKGAAGHYLATIELDKAHVKARVRMGMIYLLGGTLDKAQEQAAEALKLDPRNPDGLALQGAVLARQGDSAGAKQSAQTALEIDAGNVNAIALLTSLHISQKEFDEALAVLKQGLTKNPKQTGLLMLKAKLQADQGHADQAAQTFEEIIAIEPANLGQRVVLANIYIQQKQLDKAEKTLRDGMSVAPENTAVKLALVDFLAAQRGRELAEKELLSFIAQDPKTPALRFGLGKLYEAGNQPVKAKEVYQHFIDQGGEGPEVLTAKNKLAGVLLRENQPDAAALLLEEVLVKSASNQEALTLRAELALMRNQPEQAIADLRTAMKGDPNSTQLMRLLARAHLRKNEPELAKDQLEKAIEVAPNDAQVRAELAQLHGAQGQFDQAIGQLREAIKLMPNNPALQEALFKAHGAKKDWAAAHEVARQFKVAFPDQPLGFHMDGLAYQGEQKFEASIPEFERAIELSPDAAEPLSQLVKSYLVLKNPKGARDRLSKLIGANPKHFLARNLLGEVLLLDKKWDEAQQQFQQAIELNPKWPIPHRNLAELYRARKDDTKAIETLVKGLEATGNNNLLATVLAGLYEQTGRYDEAIQLFEKLLAKDPKSPLLANNLAMFLVDHKEDPASLDKASRLIEPLKTSKEPAFLDTVGWVLYKRGELDAAIKHLEQAVKVAPDADVMHYHLGMAYFKKGDAANAKPHLEQAAQSKVVFAGLEEAKVVLEKLK